eukprot:268302_1
MGNKHSKAKLPKYDTLAFARSLSDEAPDPNPKDQPDRDHYDIQQKIVTTYINQTFGDIKLYGVIPELIYYICFMYYVFQFDKWNSNYYNKFVILSSSSIDKIFDKFTIDSNRWKTIFGSVMVDSMRYSNGCVYEWTLKIIEINNAAIIGLSSITGLVDDCCWMKSHQKYYAWYTHSFMKQLQDFEVDKQGFMCHNNECINYEQTLRANDIIGIHLNVSNKTLIFYQNNEQIYCFNDIDLSVPYWLTVSCNGKDSSIQIVDFNINQISKMKQLKYYKEQSAQVIAHVKSKV